MAQLYCTGPAHTYIQFGSAKPLYMGTAKLSPQIEIKRSFKPVYNDIGGDVPFDMSKQGKEAITTVEYTRWSDPLYEKLGVGYGASDGLDTALDIGTLMLTEGLGFTFYVLFPFALSKKAYASLIPGYRFPASYLLGPDKHQQMGTHPKELFLMFHHLRSYNPSTGALLLYDSNVAPVVSIPPV